MLPRRRDGEKKLIERIKQRQAGVCFEGSALPASSEEQCVPAGFPDMLDFCGVDFKLAEREKAERVLENARHHSLAGERFDAFEEAWRV